MQDAILAERKRQAEFAPAGSSLTRAGATSLAMEIKRYQKRQMEDLEKELSRSRRIVDESTRVVASKRDEINLLRKQAMVLNDEFLRVRSVHTCQPSKAMRACHFRCLQVEHLVPAAGRRLARVLVTRTYSLDAHFLLGCAAFKRARPQQDAVGTHA